MQPPVIMALLVLVT